MIWNLDKSACFEGYFWHMFQNINYKSNGLVLIKCWSDCRDCDSTFESWQYLLNVTRSQMCDSYPVSIMAPALIGPRVTSAGPWLVDNVITPFSLEWSRVLHNMSRHYMMLGWCPLTVLIQWHVLVTIRLLPCSQEVLDIVSGWEEDYCLWILVTQRHAKPSNGCEN